MKKPTIFIKSQVHLVHPSGLEPEPKASELAKFYAISCKAHYIVLFLLFHFYILCIAFIKSTPYNNFYGVRVYIGCKFSGCIFCVALAFWTKIIVNTKKFAMRFPVENFAAIRKISDYLFVSNFCRQPIAKLKQMCYNYDISQKWSFVRYGI